VDIIFPLIDPDIPVLSEHRAAIERTGAKVAVVRPESARIAGDKWRTHGLFESLGLRTPRSWLPQDLAGKGATFPLFVKPREGSASKKCFRVDTCEELEFFSRYVDDAIIQEFLPGPEITTDIACTLDADVLSVVSRRRIEVRGGEVTKGVTVKDPSIIDGCVRIAHALPAVGPITVQCMLKDGVPHYTEINARFGGGLPLGIAAGADSPRWLLASLAGIEQDIPPLGSYTDGLFCSRFDDSFFFSESAIERLNNYERLERVESLQSHRVRS
jgi:carbamoyl-phosphate synthase large subunit